MEEKWVKIDDWEGYEVSDRAHVRSYRDRYGFKKDKFLDEPIQLKIQTNKDGYEFVRLMRNRKQKKVYLHDLIGRAFIPNPDDKPEINHKNGIKNDNRIEEYGALSSNFKRLKAINVETGEERIYSSRKEASSDLKIPDSYISNIIAGRSYKTRGWTFENFPPKLDKR